MSILGTTITNVGDLEIVTVQTPWGDVVLEVHGEKLGDPVKLLVKTENNDSILMREVAQINTRWFADAMREEVAGMWTPDPETVNPLKIISKK